MSNEIITQDVVTAKINIALTKQQLSIQSLQTEADSIPFTEESVPVWSEYFAKLKKIDDVISETHKQLKQPYLEAGRVVDAAKNSSLSLTAAIRNEKKPKFDAICAEIDRKKREAEAEIAKEKAILQGIESNVISFSSQIASCTTNEQLLSVERNINLEKSPSRNDKYGKFHQQAIEKYDTVLKPILKDQKEKIHQKEQLEKKIKEAEANDDVVKLDELSAQKEKVDEEILQNQVKVQETAILNASIDNIPTAEEVFTETKGRRSYSMEIIDLKEAIKKSLDLLDVSINKDAANVVLKTLKDTGAFSDKSEVVLNGIKYSEIKNYK